MVSSPGRSRRVHVEQEARVVVPRPDRPLSRPRSRSPITAPPFCTTRTGSSSVAPRRLERLPTAAGPCAAEPHEPARVGRAAEADLVPRPGVGVEAASIARMHTDHARLTFELLPRPALQSGPAANSPTIASRVRALGAGERRSAVAADGASRRARAAPAARCRGRRACRRTGSRRGARRRAWRRRTRPPAPAARRPAPAPCRRTRAASAPPRR